ncbi:MAG: phytoene/squalene synthase family protein [Deltaproteobacteria bacterium]|nr:phytoene/squalene synthase family protein [Deltaproteobacteria bacterium]
MSPHSTENRCSLLYQLLPQVSRSFYLSLRVLPQRVRQSIGLAYLFCRAADTIADTALLPHDLRLGYLDQYRAAFGEAGPTAVTGLQQHLADQQHNPAERELLARLTDCFALLSGMEQDDQRYIRELVLTLSQGMQMDLTVFPGEGEGKVAALETRADLDRYAYFVAGCVGEFWTRITTTHIPSLQHWDVEAMAARGVQFGKGLQLTNILRDIAQDLRLGRCYLPGVDLAALGVRPEELLDPPTLKRVRPLVNDLLDLTLSYYRAGWAYTLAIPRREWRLRLACAWPLLIGVSTLTLVNHSPQLLDPTVRVKIARAQVYAILLRSFFTVWSDRALDRYYRQLLGGLGAR